MKNLILLAAIFAVGCNDKGDTSDTTAEEGGGEEGGGAVDPDFSTNWGGSSMSLDITNGSGSYWLGMAETGCADPGNCWYGEDCIYGDTTGTYFYCHPTSSTGVTLTYVTTLDLDEATETLFSAGLESATTYYVESDGSANCWIWGHDTSYYAGLGCTEM